MNIKNNATRLCLVIFACALLINFAGNSKNSKENTEHDEHAHEHKTLKKSDEHLHENSEDNHEKSIKIAPERQTLANIKVDVLQSKKYESKVYAPAEVKANGYQSYVVSPRTDSVVISRHASLGDHVSTGQALVTLFSETMAQAQASFLIASSEWHRAKKLDKSTISERALVKAENEYKASYGQLIAFGLTPKAISQITSQDKLAFGEYALTAKRDGVVLKDDFMQGQRIEAGETIMLIADEQTLWVDAYIPASTELDLLVNSTATVVYNAQSYPAKIIQEAHTIDPTTRTRVIRLAVDNVNHALHAGLFVKVYFSSQTKTALIAVPEEAIARDAENDWIVFTEDKQGQFKAVKVKRGQSFGKYQEIIGIAEGTRVAINGAFFIASEIAKSGFDPHNH